MSLGSHDFSYKENPAVRDGMRMFSPLKVYVWLLFKYSILVSILACESIPLAY